MEEWRLADGFDGRYEISNQGNIRSTGYAYRRTDQSGRVTYRWIKSKSIKPGRKARGYLLVSLTAPGWRRSKSFSLAPLVCATFHGPRPAGLECAHLNGVSNDNRADNLVWATKAENGLHRREHGTSQKFCRIKKAEIMERRDNGERGCDLAKQFGIDPQTITVWRRERRQLKELRDGA